MRGEFLEDEKIGDWSELFGWEFFFKTGFQDLQD